MKLCTYSKSELLSHLILSECPLEFPRHKAKRCKCRKREYHVPPADLRVLSCTYPNDYQGNPVVTAKAEIEMPEETKEAEPFWGLVNGKPLKIRTMAATGPHGSGKSLLGDTIDPRNTCKIDIESSSTAFNLPFKRHHILFEELKGEGETPTPTECFLWFKKLVEDIEPGEFTVVSVDPINEIQQGAFDYVMANPAKFGGTKAQFEKMSGTVWGHVGRMIEQLVGQLSKKIETFYYVLHEGSVWKNGKPVEGKKKAKGGAVFRKMADLIFVLDRPVDPMSGKQVEAPMASIAPPVGKSRLVWFDDQFQPHPILPPHIKDLTPTKLRQYIAKPANYSALKKDERVPQAAALTEDEKLQLKKEISENEAEAARSRAEVAAAAQRADERNQQVIAERKAAREAEETKAAAVQSSTADMPTQKSQTEKANLTKPDLIAIVKEQFKEQGLSKPEMIERIASHSAPGTKLADMTQEQLEALKAFNWSKGTQEDMEKK